MPQSASAAMRERVKEDYTFRATDEKIVRSQLFTTVQAALDSATASAPVAQGR